MVTKNIVEWKHALLEQDISTYSEKCTRIVQTTLECVYEDSLPIPQAITVYTLEMDECSVLDFNRLLFFNVQYENLLQKLNSFVYELKLVASVHVVLEASRIDCMVLELALPYGGIRFKPRS